MHLSASQHKNSSVWGLEVSESHSVSPTFDAPESSSAYPPLPGLFLLLSISI